MGFFEGIRRRAQEHAEIAREGYKEALHNANIASVQVNKSERALQFTETRNAELWKEEEEIIHLELKEKLIKTHLDSARSHLNHLEQMESMQTQLLEQQAVLARLKKEKLSAVTEEDYSAQAAKARKEVTTLEQQHRDVATELTTIRTRMQHREQELRKQFGLTEND